MRVRIGQRGLLPALVLLARALPQIDPQLALGTPELVQTEVGGDREHPGGQPALGAVAQPEAEDLDEDVLRDLLGTRLVADQPADVLQDARPEALEQLRKRRLVPLPAPRSMRRDVGVGRRGGTSDPGPRAAAGLARGRDPRHRTARF